MLFLMFGAVIRRYERLYFLLWDNGRFYRCHAFPIFFIRTKKRSHRVVYYAKDSKYASRLFIRIRCKIIS